MDVDDDEQASLLALAKRPTSVRITEGLLRDAEFQLIRLPYGLDEK